MDRFYGYNNCTADPSNKDNELPITYETIAEYLHFKIFKFH